MSEYILATEPPLNEWTAVQLSEYLRGEGLGDYAELFLNNNVTGSIAHRISEQNLKEMGVDKVGDRLSIMHALVKLKKAKKLQEREKVIEGEKVLRLRKGEGTDVHRKIKNQVEQMQRMERS